MSNNESSARIGPQSPRMMTGRLHNTHRPEGLYRRPGRLMCVATLDRGRLSKKKKTKVGGWLYAIPEEMLLPDVEVLEALSRGDEVAVGPARQQTLFEQPNEFEALRIRIKGR